MAVSSKYLVVNLQHLVW